MKQILFFFFLGITQFALAQPFGDASKNFRISKMDYDNSGGEKGTTYFFYDVNGRLDKAFWTLADASRNSINKYQYDENGLLVSAYREFSDGLSSFELFYYDSLGNKTSEYFYRSDSVSGFATYQYENNRLQMAVLKKYKGWLNGEIKYEYNDTGELEKAQLLRNETPICNISYQYGQNGNLIKEDWDFQGKWKQAFYYHYELKNSKANYYSSPLLSNSSRYRISKESYTYNDEIGGPSLYYYDRGGLLAKKVFIRSDSVSTTTFYHYDSQRKLILSERNYSDGSQAKFHYTYNENKQLILRTFHKNDSLVGFESYQYNEDGNIVKAYLRNFDNWLSGTINYHLDGTGNPKTADFIGESGFSAELTFSYNENFLLSKAVWKFSFGKFQEYNFYYEPIESLETNP